MSLALVVAAVGFAVWSRWLVRAKQLPLQLGSAGVALALIMVALFATSVVELSRAFDSVREINPGAPTSALADHVSGAMLLLRGPRCWSTRCS